MQDLYKSVQVIFISFKLQNVYDETTKTNHDLVKVTMIEHELNEKNEKETIKIEREV